MRRIRLIMIILGAVSIGFGAVYIYQDKVGVDTTGPAISFDAEEITVAIGTDDKEMLSGVTAMDDQDGDVTESLMVEDIKKNDEVFNQFEVRYLAFDQSSNSTNKTRILHYEGYHKPRFSIARRLSFSRRDEIVLSDYIKAEDSFDGDVSSYIVVEGSEQFADNPVAGTYDCTLSVTNSIGDTATLPIQVEIYDESYEEHILAPQLTLTEQLVYLEQGAVFDAAAYLDSVNYNGVVKINDTPEGISSTLITQNSDVNTAVPGNYSVTYEYVTLDGAQTLSAKLLVVVE